MSDDQQTPRINEDELRDTPETIDRLGPEDETAEETMDGMEEYGYDVMDENMFESSVTNESDQPEWLNRESRERSNLTEDDEGPVEGDRMG